MLNSIEQVSKSKCFGGFQMVYKHDSRELGCSMNFSVFLPSTVADPSSSNKLPIVYFLSGLTCTEQNMITKSAIQRYAEENQLIIVGPDTSPRGCNVPGENDRWDLGTGAGFYVDALEEPWSKHYRMYSYVTKELRDVVEANIPCVDKECVGITGHSMGGHGALIAFLRNPELYKAVSAFAPISNPMKGNWGKLCFTTYLGENETLWEQYDATELVKKQPRKDKTILVEQGSEDPYLSNLLTENFVAACKEVGQPIEYNLRDGYDHGYYFVSTFIENHLKHFSKVLRN